MLAATPLARTFGKATTGDKINEAVSAFYADVDAAEKKDGGVQARGDRRDRGGLMRKGKSKGKGAVSA